MRSLGRVLLPRRCASCRLGCVCVCCIKQSFPPLPFKVYLHDSIGSERKRQLRQIIDAVMAEAVTASTSADDAARKPATNVRGHQGCIVEVVCSGRNDAFPCCAVVQFVMDFLDVEAKVVVLSRSLHRFVGPHTACCLRLPCWYCTHGRARLGAPGDRAGVTLLCFVVVDWVRACVCVQEVGRRRLRRARTTVLCTFKLPRRCHVRHDWFGSCCTVSQSQRLLPVMARVVCLTAY